MKAGGGGGGGGEKGSVEANGGMKIKRKEVRVRALKTRACACV